MAERRWHVVGDGTKLEVLYTAPSSPPAVSHGAQHSADDDQSSAAPLQAASAADAAAAVPLPPLLFVHGAFHGAWCWAEHWLPFFVAAGWPCYAVSLRGHGGSEAGPQPPTLQTHADDLASLIATLPRPPVLVVHSAAGLVAAQYVSQLRPGCDHPPQLAALVMLCAAPPSGNGGCASRTAKRSPWTAAKIVWCFIRKSFRASPAACRFLFFSPELPEPELRRYCARLAAEPPRQPLCPSSARPPPAPPTPAGWPGLAPQRVLVGRGALDVLVDAPAAEEAAAYFGGAAVQTWEGVAHDCMLDARWHDVAEGVLRWMQAQLQAAP